MRTLDAMLEEINESLRLNLNNTAGYTNLGNSTQFYRQASLFTQNDQTYPLVDDGQLEGRKISIDDTYPLQIYHRVLDSEHSEDPDSGRGKNTYRFKHYMMRLVGVGNVSRLATSKTYDQNEDIEIQVYQAIPKMLINKEMVLIGDEETNKKTVFDQEFEGYDVNYLRLNYIAFYIDYTIKVLADCALEQVELINYADVVGVTANAYVIR